MYVDTFVTLCRKIIIRNQNTRFWIPMVYFPIFSVFAVYLTLRPLTWRIWWAPNNASRWQMGFNSAFKGLNTLSVAHAYFCLVLRTRWAGSLSRYSDCLRAGRSGDRIPARARLFALVQTGPGAHPASCTMGIGSFPGVKSGRGVTLTPHPLLLPWSWKSRAIPLLLLWVVRPVQSLSACTRVHFALFYFTSN